MMLKMITPRSVSRMQSQSVTGLFLLALAVVSVVVAGAVEVRNVPERTIEKPSSRAATAFVPRIGKRLAAASLDSYVARPPCSNALECNQQALLGALIRGIMLQDGDLNLVSSDPLEESLAMGAGGQQALAGSPAESFNEDGARWLRLFRRDQVLRRETRNSPDESEEMVSVPKYGGAKRVAFTPRIGRR